jgi:type I restriction enzyme M protein
LFAELNAIDESVQIEAKKASESGKSVQQTVCAFANEPGFAQVASLAEVAANGYSLSIPLYVTRPAANGAPADTRTLAEVWSDWEQDGHAFWQQMDTLVETLDRLNTEGDADA